MAFQKDVARVVEALDKAKDKRRELIELCQTRDFESAVVTRPAAAYNRAYLDYSLELAEFTRQYCAVPNAMKELHSHIKPGKAG